MASTQRDAIVTTVRSISQGLMSEAEEVHPVFICADTGVFKAIEPRGHCSLCHLHGHCLCEGAIVPFDDEASIDGSWSSPTATGGLMRLCS